jgi:SEL1 protein
MSLVSRNLLPRDSQIANILQASKKDWSLSEWVANFLKEDPYYDDVAYEDLYDDTITGSDGEPIGDEYDDDGVIDSLIILGLAAVILFLVYYRQQRQQAHRQAEENAARAGGVAQPPPAQPGAAPQPGNPGDPVFQPWGAGGLGF